MAKPATRGGQIGNENAIKPRILSDALRKHIAQNPKKLETTVAALWDKATTGDIQAIKEILDRLEGKAMQPIEQKTEHSGAISFEWVK